MTVFATHTNQPITQYTEPPTMFSGYVACTRHALSQLLPVHLQVWHSAARGIWNVKIIRADFRLAPSQWETALLCNDVSHWLGASLELALGHWCSNYLIQDVYTLKPLIKYGDEQILCAFDTISVESLYVNVPKTSCTVQSGIIFAAIILCRL